MRGEIVLKSVLGGYSEKPAVFSVGGYTVMVNGNPVSFDWEGSSTNVEILEDGHLVFTKFQRKAPRFSHGDESVFV